MFYIERTNELLTHCISLPCEELIEQSYFRPNAWEKHWRDGVTERGITLPRTLREAAPAI